MENMPLSFEVKLDRIPVVLTVEGKRLEYSLRELDGTDRDAFVQSMQDRADKGSDVISNVIGLQSSLLCKSLYDENGTAVTAEKCQKFPSTMLSELFIASQKLSKLDENESEAIMKAKVKFCTALKNGRPHEVLLKALIAEYENEPKNS
jgi:hypothetical protein